MNTLILEKPGHFAYCQTPEPGEPGPGEARVRVKHVGLCGTDIHAYHGRQPFFTYPRILGHELGVVVEAVGPGVETVYIGDRCAVEPYLAGPGDRAYARGRTNCSASTRCLGVHVDGGMRERFILPAAKLHAAPLETSQLALVETLCIGHHAVQRAAMLGDEEVAVIGLGPIGLTVLESLLLGQGNLTLHALDVDPRRLATCRALFPGISTHQVDPSASLVDQWPDWGKEAPEVVFDCTGFPPSMEAAISLAGHGGRVVFVGLCKGRLSFDDPDFHRRELSLISSRNALPADFRRILDALAAGRIDPARWITHRVAAADFPDCIEEWLQPGSGLLKGVLEF